MPAYPLLRMYESGQETSNVSFSAGLARRAGMFLSHFHVVQTPLQANEFRVFHTRVWEFLLHHHKCK
jgi:hypothetical protein